MKKNEWNANEYNLQQVDDRLWKWTATIVVRCPFKDDADLKLLNKFALKHIHSVFAGYFYKHAKGYNKSFLGFCAAEKQKQTGLLHFHTVLGDVWKPKLWFNNPKSEVKRHESLTFRIKASENMDAIAHDVGCILLETHNEIRPDHWKFNQSYQTITIISAEVNPYYPETCDGPSWKSYICKEDYAPYWTPAYHALVKRINKANQEPGLIPEDLRHLRCWTETKQNEDIMERLRGGDFNGR